MLTSDLIESYNSPFLNLQNNLTELCPYDIILIFEANVFWRLLKLAYRFPCKQTVSYTGNMVHSFAFIFLFQSLKQNDDNYSLWKLKFVPSFHNRP